MLGLTHQIGCMPQNPCVTCKVLEYAQRSMTPEAHAHFLQLTKEANKVLRQEELERTPWYQMCGPWGLCI